MYLAKWFPPAASLKIWRSDPRRSRVQPVRSRRVGRRGDRAGARPAPGTGLAARPGAQVDHVAQQILHGILGVAVGWALVVAAAAAGRRG